MVQKMQRDNAKSYTNRKKLKFHCSILTVTLLFCILYFSYSVFLNISKCVNMPAKIIKMKELNQNAIAQNKKLKDEIANFESLHSLEAIARNNLKMAGEDEILIIVNHEEVPESADESN